MIAAEVVPWETFKAKGTLCLLFPGCKVACDNLKTFFKLPVKCSSQHCAINAMKFHLHQHGWHLQTPENRKMEIQIS